MHVAVQLTLCRSNVPVITNGALTGCRIQLLQRKGGAVQIAGGCGSIPHVAGVTNAGIAHSVGIG